MVKTKISPTAQKYILTVMEDDIEAAEARKTEIWNEKKGDIVLRGFRKGKVPREHAEKIIGYDNLYEDCVREVVNRGLAESGKKIVGVGQVVIDVLDKDKPTVLRAEVWLEPSVNLLDEDGNKRYEGLEADIPTTTVAPEEVDALIQRMREAAATTKSVERESATDDVVVIDFEGKLEDGSPFVGGTAKDYQVVVGSGTLLSDFEVQLVGVKTGETKDITIQFPPNYPKKDLSGKKAIFTTKINDVKERHLSEVDDEFAQQMGYADLVEARSKLETDLRTNKEQQVRVQVEQQLLNGVLVGVPVEPIPPTMIKHQTDNSIQNLLEGVGMNLEQYLKKTGSTEEQLRAQYQQQAATDVRARLILKAIAENEGLAATPEEEEAALKAILPRYQGVDLETLRQQIDMDSLTLNIRVQKAMDFVREKSVPRKKGPTAPPKVTVDPSVVSKEVEAEVINE